MSQQQKIFIRVLFFIPALLFLAAILISLQKQADTTLTLNSITFEDADFAVNIPDKALIKNYLTVSLETTPGTTCKLTFVPPSGNIREMAAIADLNGQCTWRWKLEETDGKGHGRLIFTVNGMSDTHFIDIRESF